MFIGTWALIRPMRNIFSPVSGWNALSYKYLHLHNSSSVIFKSARLSPFLYNNCLVNIRTKLNRGWVITCIWWPRLVHSPAVCQWQTDSKGSSQRGSEAPYPCTCSDPNTVSRCRFYPSTSCQLLRLLVPSPTGSSLSHLFLRFLCHTHTRPRNPTTRPYQVLCLRQSPPLASILRREDDFIRADPRERTLKRLARPRLNRTVAQRDIAPSPACSTFRSRFDFSLYLPRFSPPSMLLSITPARLRDHHDAQLTSSAKRWWHFISLEFGIFCSFVRFRKTVVLYVKCVVNFVISF